jgi:putative MATE family efflux protein
MKKTYDLTQGGIVNRLLLVALPIMGSMLMQMAYNLTDMFWLGRIDNEAVASSGTAGMYMWLSMGFVLIGRMGAEIGVAQNLGRRDFESAKAYSQNALFVSLVLGVAGAVFTVAFSEPMIAIFNIREANVAKDAADYLRIVGAALPTAFVAASVSGTFGGSGNSRMIFVSNAAGLVVNMILDPLFIFGLGLNVAGAGIATAIAQAVAAVILLIALKKNRGRPFEVYAFRFRPDPEKLRQIFKWTVPVALESVLFTVLSMLITRFVTDFGADALATQRVGSQIESLSWLLGGGFGSALTAFVGQNYGAGKQDRIRRSFRLSLLIMTAWGLFVTAALFFGGRALFSVFLRGGNILDMGDTYLKILAGCQILACYEAVAAGAFRGVGQTIPPSVSSIVFNALRVPLCWLLSLTPLGLNGIWLGITIGASLRGAATFVWYLARQRAPKHEMPIKQA